MADNPSETVGVGIEVVANSLTLIVSESEVGVWPLNRIDVDVEEDGFHVQVDGEEFVFVTRQAEEFARAVGVLDRPVNGNHRAQTQVKTAKAKPVKSKAAKSRPAKARKSQAAKPAKAVRATKPATKTPKVRSARPRINLPDIDWSSPRVQAATAGLVMVALLAITATPILAFLMMGAGSIGLLVGTGSLVDPIMATRLPTELPPAKMILVSTLLVVVGMTILTFI
ncbi:MAG TPA: hypothetical protein VJQ57_03290 [Acidimicrobiia bacterium]|nr:hypothetical protein [Acidimicrobiia bacterium]